MSFSDLVATMEKCALYYSTIQYPVVVSIVTVFHGRKRAIESDVAIDPGKFRTKLLKIFQNRG